MVHAWCRFLKGNHFLFAWHNSQHSEILIHMQRFGSSASVRRQGPRRLRAVILLGSYLWHCLPTQSLWRSPPETRGRRSFQKMTRIFWLLWSWKVCLLVWSPTCWAESLNWTHAPIWLPYNVSRELNKINSYCVWGVPPPRSHVWQSAPLRLIFFQRSELLSDPRGPSNPPSPQQLWTVRSWRQDFYRQRLVRSGRFHEYLQQKQETATVWTWCRESELFF